MNRKYLAILLPLIAAVAASTWDALAGSKERPEAVSSESGTGLSGEELWSNNCQRCHNLRSPVMYTPTQYHRRRATGDRRFS